MLTAAQRAAQRLLNSAGAEHPDGQAIRGQLTFDRAAIRGALAVARAGEAPAPELQGDDDDAKR